MMNNVTLVGLSRGDHPGSAPCHCMTPEQWTWHQNSEHDTRTVNMTPEQWTWHQNSEHDTRFIVSAIPANSGVAREGALVGTFWGGCTCWLKINFWKEFKSCNSSVVKTIFKSFKSSNSFTFLSLEALNWKDGLEKTRKVVVK